MVAKTSPFGLKNRNLNQINSSILTNKLSLSMKSMLKSELAERAGVSVTTLMNWCKPYHQELVKLGLRPNAKVLPPRIVAFIAEKFCIDIK